VGGRQRLTRRERSEPARPGVPWDDEPARREARSGGSGVALPNRFRRRLTWVIVGVVGVSSGLLAGGTYLAGRHYRTRSFTDRAVYQTRIDLALTADAPFPSGFDHLSDIYRQLGGVESLAIGPGGAVQTSLPGLALGDVPAGLRRSINDDGIVMATTTVRGTPYLVTGGRPPGTGVELYFFFTRRGLIDSLTAVRDWLLIGWLVVLALAALVARRMALVTLRPVRATAGAARSLAEGLLSTRLRAETDDEFGALASYFNDMAEALEQKITALSEARDREKRFTMFAAHELRTPLAGMSTTASLLEEDFDALPERARRPAELLVADVARLRGLVLNLLELGRLDAGLDDIGWEPVPLDDLAATIARRGGWPMPVEVVSEPVVVLSERWGLERIIVNLVANAVQHGGRDVRVVVRRRGDVGVVEVCDAGPGIPEENIPHLFERFYTTGRGSGGSGLGLAIVRQHVDRLGAALEVHSTVGRGTCMVLMLPSAASVEPLQQEERSVALDRPVAVHEQIGEDAVGDRHGVEPLPHGGAAARDDVEHGAVVTPNLGHP
jgi:two-component system sensor histidine kinase MtrB